MARIELRDATLRVYDGLNGSALVNETTTATDLEMNITTVNLPDSLDTDLVPIGARFTVNTANNVTTYTVTGRTPATTGPTTNIAFSPALGVNCPALNDVVTFLPQRIEVTVGEGNVTWTETKNYDYLLDRGDLDTVREGDEAPLDLSLEFVYEFVTTGTNEVITPVDAIKGIGGADEWVSSSTDPCEPYAVDIEILHCVPCGSVEDEKVVFPDFRYESLDFDLSAATIATKGKCNASEAIVTRAHYPDCT